MAGQFPQYIWIASEPVQILTECKMAKTIAKGGIKN